jgi:hypothetical protein
MRSKVINMAILVACGAMLGGVVLTEARRAPAPGRPARVSLQAPATVKSGKTFTIQVRVDTADATGLGSGLGAFVIPVQFDPAKLEFVAAGGGESPEFAGGPTSATSPAAANAAGVVTLVGSQTAADALTGVVGVASLTFKAIAPRKGETAVAVAPDLGTSRLSLASTSGATSAEPSRIPAVGEAANIFIKRRKQG